MNDCGRQDRQRATDQCGRRRDRAICGSALHQRADDAKIFFGAGAVVHLRFTLYYKVKSSATTFLRVSFAQKGEGALMKKIAIMTSAMSSLATMPARFPSKLPQPARP